MVGATYYDDDGKWHKKSNVESMQNLTKLLGKLNINKENINDCGKQDGKSKKAGTIAWKNQSNNNKNEAAVNPTKESATVNDVLKSNNSSKFNSKRSYFYYKLRCMKRKKAKAKAKAVENYDVDC